MPELPEVESVRRQLAPELTGRTIVDVWWDHHPQQRFNDVDDAVGGRVIAVERRGKFLLLPLVEAGAGGEPDQELVLHLGMTGSFAFDRRDAYARATFDLDDGRTLVFRDPRRFGRVSVVPAGDHASIPTLAALGPEPLTDDFDPDTFAARLSATTAPVKAALLGQRLVAGVGNIYADEALWRARIHPLSRRVGRSRAQALHGAIRAVLSEAVEREGTTFRDYRMVNGESGRNADFLDAYGQEGLPCRRCGTPMRKIVVAQRGTTYCARCQRP
ncbi:MAG: bifunctional DNA-formamidopyrimidine glycosylase/DNA-(apurinic or apyrimidinic site) lyase [Actinobacteria bacterium]|nr:bifunctional DNA-formamidopyrimidine glycosylase/DNA-(apurinic or apyrimidinic site) lyase [Actinomycetota bacterium]